MVSSSNALQLLCILATVLFMIMKNCNGMAFKKDIEDKSSDLKEDLEGRFNQTVAKVVEIKMFLMNAVAFSINKTTDVLLATKQHLKGTKNSLRTKISESISKTAHELDDLKEELHGHKQVKTTTNQAQQNFSLTRDFLAAPVFPIINEMSTVPFVPSENRL